MSEVIWTKEQLQAIEEKNTNILVAAAAGSGKTAVLVERIIHKLIDEKINIDELLVVTFTNAAASEMRQRILDAIYQKLEENPEDEHMQRQTILMAKSNICTIHSFCLEVIRNHFYELGIAPNIRIADQTEIEILKQEVLEEIFEEKYEENNEKFLTLIHTYTSYRGDEPLKELILKMDRYIKSSPFPGKWLAEKIEKFQIKEQDFASTTWGNILMQAWNEEIESCIIQLQSIVNSLRKERELEKFLIVVEQDIIKMQELKKKQTWDAMYEEVLTFKFDTWPRDTKIVLEQKEIAKQKRDRIKKSFNTMKDKLFIYNSEQAKEDMNQMYPTLLSLKEMVLEFGERFAIAKKEKNSMDFHDIEHFALQLLVKQDTDGCVVPTEIAKKYQEQFKEIAIDEYQDSNLVQEYILSTISKGNNMFMVGDVKQSIYKFRQARPELFIQKYENYVTKEAQKEEEPLKIQLFKNFRSRQNILDITNYIFQKIMSKELGDITYNEDEYLNLGANYPEAVASTLRTELHIMDTKEKEEDEEEEIEERIEEDAILEVKMVIKKIQELIENKYPVYDKKIGRYRDIRFQDIVILLRATSSLAPIYEKELSHADIPVFSDTGSQYLDTIEIQTMVSVLKTIDNPRQDIPFVSVLRSMIGGFDDNELMEIKLASKEKKQNCFYETFVFAKEKVREELRQKIERYLTQIGIWRKMQESHTLEELVWQIYLDSGYYHYVSLMPNGEIRKANLKLLFEKAKQYEKSSFKGLFNFITFLDKLRNSNSDMDSAKLIGENENVVRIMSIHKSKGLEFPVVFLCGTSKKFNMQDLNETILLHQDIGLGPKYIDYERKIEYNTLAKEAISHQTKIETLSEEMRVLYVALTRAKEKLIITGLAKDIQKDLEQKEELLQSYQGNTIPISILKKYKSYLDWIELVYMNHKEKTEELLELHIHDKQEFISCKQEENKEISLWEKLQDNEVEQAQEEAIKELLDWKYPNTIATTLPTKLSVTQIKEQKQLVKGKKQVEVVNYTKPNFMKEDLRITSAEKGTLIHLCIQRMNEKQDYDVVTIKNMIQEFVAKEQITQEEADAISISSIVEYTKSALWQELKMAKEIYKEQAFYSSLPASYLYQEETKEHILVQGVIDLYYINEKEQLILVDYKTDHIKESEQELVDKYTEQLMLYKEALEEALKKKVDRVEIYSVELAKTIEIIN